MLVGANSTYPTQQKQWFQQIGTEFHQLTEATISWDTYSSTSDEQTKLMSAALVSGLPVVLLYMVFQRYLVSGLTTGTTKA